MDKLVEYYFNKWLETMENIFHELTLEQFVLLEDKIINEINNRRKHDVPK